MTAGNVKVYNRQWLSFLIFFHYSRFCPGLRHLTTTKQQIQNFGAPPNLQQSTHQGRISRVQNLQPHGITYCLTDEMMTKNQEKNKDTPPNKCEQPRFGSYPPLRRPYSSETGAGLATAAALAATDSAAFTSRLFFKMSHFVKTSPSPGMRCLFIYVAIDCRNQMVTDVSTCG